ncbi:long-chain-fatty-acyl-CoA reductase [Pseudomonas sp. SWRI92]|uniref:Long-chain-fatty-acyl-CoA reductase n=1 Tax=Pseudomonas marvdashtae TaxID=2745500 RepID=A0A923FKK0_9PSED|nr:MULTISPECIES: acyl-CoA reductase [Pseudomonas]MBC3372549.1 long-chain-fatty-acyl-CoA reductase [Pseudomonas sp. SWRI92]MBV4551751.1 long-chain-fatty-acyl-CoA reductase [Pseudomonas marvdashtae]
MYLINGQLSADLTLETALECLQAQLPALLDVPPRSEEVLDCAEAFVARLRTPGQQLMLDEGQRQALITFCDRKHLSLKLERELGASPRSLRRIDYGDGPFESWQPLGLVVHVTPGNSALLGFCAALEGLLAGNVNWLRPSARDGDLTARLLAAFLSGDPSGRLHGYVAVLPVPAKESGRLFALAQGVSAWGGNTALTALREQIPSGCRWIDWGHRVSFAYITPAAASDQALDSLVDEICRLDQQACSSPQWLLVDSNEPAQLQALGNALAAAFERRSGHWPALEATAAEACEITTRTALARLDYSFAGAIGEVWAGDGWRILWEHHRELLPSPLFRTLLLRPVPEELLCETLLPWRNVLQSCALICAPEQAAGLTRHLLIAGVTRVASTAAIQQGYDGEPHDGVYALQRLSRRVSVGLAPDVASHRVTLDAVAAAVRLHPSTPIMDKAAFIALPPTPQAQLFFRSGGSSGAPVLSPYSYRDFDSHMRAAADGLRAAGLDPSEDRVMNLFYGGSLYGGFLSFTKILEQMKVVHYPMSAPADEDFPEIAQLIVDHRINTVVGMPSTLHRLFASQQRVLQRYGGVHKVLLGGEHVGPDSRTLFQQCGATRICSAIYGTVDAGPLGHACLASDDGVFHLMDDIQYLEIVQPDIDSPVAAGETGRLLFTSRIRQARPLQRYEVGDLGRWLPGRCACGLESPRFQLRERHGHLLRVATEFINSRELVEQAQAAIQIVLDHESGGCERLLIRTNGDTETVRRNVLGLAPLRTAVDAALLILEVESCPAQRFEHKKHSGKIPLVIDRRLPG